MKFLILSVSIASLSLISCSETPKQEVVNNSILSNEVTADEVLTLLGGFSKRFKTPSDITLDEMAGLALKDHEGKIHHLPSQSGWVPNQIYKVVAYMPKDGELVCSVFSDKDFISHFSSSNFPKSITGRSLGTSIAEPGETLVKFTTNDSMHSSKKQKGEYQLIFHVYKEK